MEREKFIEQYEVADRMKVFFKTWGLKQRFVAETCGIDANIFSKFMNHVAILSEKQMNRLIAYEKDYIRRNS